jgi:hypothetical protein
MPAIQWCSQPQQAIWFLGKGPYHVNCLGEARWATGTAAGTLHVSIVTRTYFVVLHEPHRQPLPLSHIDLLSSGSLTCGRRRRLDHFSLAMARMGKPFRLNLRSRTEQGVFVVAWREVSNCTSIFLALRETRQGLSKQTFDSSRKSTLRHGP